MLRPRSKENFGISSNLRGESNLSGKRAPKKILSVKMEENFDKNFVLLKSKQNFMKTKEYNLAHLLNKNNEAAVKKKAKEEKSQNYKSVQDSLNENNEKFKNLTFKPRSKESKNVMADAQKFIKVNFPNFKVLDDTLQTRNSTFQRTNHQSNDQ